MADPAIEFREEEKVEHCGVVGIYSKTGRNVAPALFRGMIALQHRGQDAAGFAVWDGEKLVDKKGVGLVGDIFSEKDLKVNGRVGVAHTRYPTTGLCLISDVQPFSKPKIAVSHNGQISNYRELRAKLEKGGNMFSSTVDSEVVVHMVEGQLAAGGSIEDAVKHLMKEADGAYAIAALVNGELIAFRDPHGIKPLVWGENEDFIIFASETVALDINGAKYVDDVGCGEIAVVRNGKVERKTLAGAEPRSCMFEYVYFSRPDSVLDKVYVYEARARLGEELAKEHPVRADIVIEVPDSARTAAAAYARALGIVHAEGMIKNRYVGRTFIMPSQEKRKDSVRLKLNVIRKVVEGKRVVLVDDSIVRGTTLREIVGMLRKGGAAEIHVRITCPPIRAPCFYGIDMSTYKELAAHRKSVDEIRAMVGADSFGYLSIGGLRKAIGIPVCTGCLDEGYPTAYAKLLADEQKKGE